MPVLRRLLLAAVATALVVGCGVALRGGEPEPEQVSAASTPLSSYDTSRVTILRTSFCERVPDEAVEEALGAAPEDATDYGNGDRVRLAPKVRDLAHEFGCTWTAGGTTAAAWVYTPPVPRPLAATLLQQARSASSCSAVPDAPAYGEPSAALVCTTERATEFSFRGLFGDAWLTCSLRSTTVFAGQSSKDSLDRVGRWCVAVARAAADEGA